MDKYNKDSLNNLSKQDIWRSKLETPLKSDDNEYILYATGHADLNGRTYIALPANKKITKYVKNTYNLM